MSLIKQMESTLRGERAAETVNLDTTMSSIDHPDGGGGGNREAQTARVHFNDFISYHIFHAAQKSRHALLRRFLALAREDKLADNDGSSDCNKKVHNFLHYKPRKRSESELDKVFDKTALRWAVENEDT